MPRYRYLALDASGRRVSGEESAADVDALAAQLLAAGLQIESADLVDPAPAVEGTSPVDVVFNESPDVPPVSSPSAAAASPLDRPSLDRPPTAAPRRPGGDESATFIEVVERVSDLTGAGLPLVTGLRALAAESDSRRMKLVLTQISRELEAGAPVNQVLNYYRTLVPPSLVELIRAGLRTGRLGMLLNRYVTATRTARQREQKLALSLFYPGLMVVVMFTLMLAVFSFIVPSFRKIFQDFGTELPFFTRMMLSVAPFVQSALVILIALILVMFFVVGLQFFERWPRPAWGGQTLQFLPGVGAATRLSQQAEFLAVLSLLLESEVPLPEALELAGGSQGDRGLARRCELVAEAVRGGANLAEAAAATPHFPVSLVHIFSWTRRQRSPVVVLRRASEMFDARASMQTTAIQPLVEPLLVLGMGVMVGLMVIALFMPLFKLLNDLS